MHGTISNPLIFRCGWQKGVWAPWQMHAMQCYHCTANIAVAFQVNKLQTDMDSVSEALLWMAAQNTTRLRFKSTKWIMCSNICDKRSKRSHHCLGMRLFVSNKQQPNGVTTLWKYTAILSQKKMTVIYAITGFSLVLLLGGTPKS